MNSEFKKNFFCATHKDINVSRSGFCKKCDSEKFDFYDYILSASPDRGLIETYRSIIRHIESGNVIVREVDECLNPIFPEDIEFSEDVTSLVLRQCKDAVYGNLTPKPPPPQNEPHAPVVSACCVTA